MESNTFLPITEIFQSIQGEGFYAGRLATFVRLSGCNLRCPFCDTDYRERYRLSLREIVDTVKAITPPGGLVVLTGGEPTIHSLWKELARLLVTAGFYVSLETNGTNMVLLSDVQWITVSPKYIQRLKVFTASEVKVLWIKADMSSEEEFLLACKEKVRAQFYYVQPVEKNGEFLQIGEIYDFIRRNPEWKISVQLHKVLHLL